MLWLDAAEGGETATHSGGVPNIGVYVKDGAENRFMIRRPPAATASATARRWSAGANYRGRLARQIGWKSDAAYDRLALWIDPDPGSCGSRRGSLLPPAV
ncbi:MAG: hypothetical protein H7A53_10425 [Akkermansiaceae bacterium]|nr:hypothetical protein [Akkermansiaceae bacterium]